MKWAILRWVVAIVKIQGNAQGRVYDPVKYLRWNFFAKCSIIDVLQGPKFTLRQIPANIYLFKFSSRNTRKRCEICPKLTIKTPERR